MTQNIVKPAGIVAAIVALAIGASALAGATSKNASNADASTGPGNGQMQGGAPPGASGYGSMGNPPDGGSGGPGNMTEVTGEDAKKAKAAALEEVPGTAEVVMKHTDKDEYHVMVVKSDGTRVMVEVSGDFKTAEVHEGGPGNGGPPGAANGVKPNDGTSVDPGSGTTSGSTS